MEDYIMFQENQWNTFNICEAHFDDNTFISDAENELLLNGITLSNIFLKDKHGLPLAYGTKIKYSKFLCMSISEYINLIMNIVMGQGEFNRSQSERIDEKASFLKGLGEDFDGYFEVGVRIFMQGEATVVMMIDDSNGNQISEIQELKLDINRGIYTKELPSLIEPKKFLLNILDNVIDRSSVLNPSQKNCLKEIRTFSNFWTLFVYDNLRAIAKEYLYFENEKQSDNLYALLKRVLESDTFLNADKWIDWKEVQTMYLIDPEDPLRLGKMAENARELLGLMDNVLSVLQVKYY